jgi:hypothetical protein
MKVGTAKKVSVEVDVTDWREMALRLEVVPETKEDFVEAIASGVVTPRQASQCYIAMREDGDLNLPKDLISGNKILLGTGGREEANILIQACKIQVARQTVRKYTAPVQEPMSGRTLTEVAEDVVERSNLYKQGTPAPPSIVPSRGLVEAGTPASLENAKRYLEQKVPGHIFARLAEIKVAGGDVQAEADKLIANIQDMVDRLTK